LVLPSVARSEAFGLVLLEAMAAGRPAIAADVPGTGMRWVLGKGGDAAGLPVPPHDAQALASALRRMRDEPALRNALGERGRARLAAQFHIDRIAEQVEGLYRAAGCRLSPPEVGVSRCSKRARCAHLESDIGGAEEGSRGLPFPFPSGDRPRSPE
jgi:hypothetical protein